MVVAEVWQSRHRGSTDWFTGVTSVCPGRRCGHPPPSPVVTAPPRSETIHSDAPCGPVAALSADASGGLSAGACAALIVSKWGSGKTEKQRSEMKEVRNLDILHQHGILSEPANSRRRKQKRCDSKQKWGKRVGIHASLSLTPPDQLYHCSYSPTSDHLTTSWMSYIGWKKPSESGKTAVCLLSRKHGSKTISQTQS